MKVGKSFRKSFRTKNSEVRRSMLCSGVVMNKICFEKGRNGVQRLYMLKSAANSFSYKWDIKY